MQGGFQKKDSQRKLTSKKRLSIQIGLEKKILTSCNALPVSKRFTSALQRPAW